MKQKRILKFYITEQNLIDKTIHIVKAKLDDKIRKFQRLWVLYTHAEKSN